MLPWPPNQPRSPFPTPTPFISAVWLDFTFVLHSLSCFLRFTCCLSCRCALCLDHSPPPSFTPVFFPLPPPPHPIRFSLPLCRFLYPAFFLACLFVCCLSCQLVVCLDAALYELVTSGNSGTRSLVQCQIGMSWLCNSMPGVAGGLCRCLLLE